MKNWILLVMSGLLILSACTPAPSETKQPPAAQEPIHVKVGVLSYMSNSPIFIAVEQGYFAEQGLEVEVVNFGFAVTELIPAMLASQVDVGTVSMTAGILNAVAQGGNLKLVADKGFANPEACADTAWLARQALLDDGSLDELDGMRNMKVVHLKGSTFEYAHDLLLEQAGLTNADIQPLDVLDGTARLDGLRSGAIDITPHAEPWLTRARSEGFADIWVPFSDVFPNLSVGALMYGPTLLEDNPEAGVRFMVAYLKAVRQFSGEKTDRNIEIVSKYTQLSSDEVRNACWTSFQPDGEIDSETLMQFVEWAREKHYLDKPLALEELWDPQFLEAAGTRLE